MPWDASDTIKVHFDTGPTGLHGSGVKNQRAVRWGSADEINDHRRQAHAECGLINLRNLDYRLDSQNSNTAAAALLRAMGVDPKVLFRHGGFKGAVPGYLNELPDPGLF